MKTWIIGNTRGPNVTHRGTKASAMKYAKSRFINFTIYEKGKAPSYKARQNPRKRSRRAAKSRTRAYRRNCGCKRNPLKIEVWRKPNKADVKFGYGSLHYKTIAVDKVPRGGQKFKRDGRTWTYGSKRG